MAKDSCIMQFQLILQHTALICSLIPFAYRFVISNLPLYITGIICNFRFSFVGNVSFRLAKGNAMHLQLTTAEVGRFQED